MTLVVKVYDSELKQLYEIQRLLTLIKVVIVCLENYFFVFRNALMGAGIFQSSYASTIDLIK